MEIITDKDVRKAQNFFEKACQTCVCVFAQGYIGIKNKKSGDLPTCGRNDGVSSDGRMTLLGATQQNQCDKGTILVNDSITGREVFLDPVVVSPKGPKLQNNTWASFTNNSYRHPYAVDAKRYAGTIKVSNLRK